METAVHVDLFSRQNRLGSHFLVLKCKTNFNTDEYS